MDSLFHQSMTWVTENDITGALDLSFTVSEEIFGQVRTFVISMKRLPTKKNLQLQFFFSCLLLGFIPKKSDFGCRPFGFFGYKTIIKK